MNTNKRDIFAEEQLIIESGIRNVFTPSTPVNVVDMFCGREKEIQTTISNINTPGMHTLIYGERGIGKSSLAKTIEKNLKERMGYDVFVVRCGTGSNIKSIFSDVFEKVNFDANVVESTTKVSFSLNPLRLIGIGGESSNKRIINKAQVDKVVKVLSALKTVLIIDEADQLTKETKNELSEIIKGLSDNRSVFKIMIVGIAQTEGELVEAHRSLDRCLGQVKLNRMSTSELEDIINIGEERARLTFSKETKNLIVKLSGGYPHFTHLLALKSAESAIAKQKNEITTKEFESGKEKAIKQVESSLRRAYEDAIRSGTTDMYAHLLNAASQVANMKGETSVHNTLDFSAGEWRSQFYEIYGSEITQASLSNYLKRLCVRDGKPREGHIIKSSKKGFYEFMDSRMPFYINIINSN